MWRNRRREGKRMGKRGYGGEEKEEEEEEST